MPAARTTRARRAALALLVAALAPLAAAVPTGPAGAHVPFLGSAGGLPLVSPVVDMAATARGDGYWLAAADGGVFTYGRARFFGSAARLPLVSPIVGIAPRPTGDGYWLAAADGGVFTFGRARFHGSAARLRLRAPVVGIAATPTGRGYVLATADGGVFTYGDARFYGSAGALPLVSPVVGVALTPAADGYWLAAADGGVFTYGRARFFGSAGGLPLVSPVVGIGARSRGDGYWLTAADGGVFTYGRARYFGSAAGGRLRGPVTDLTPSPHDDGYWLAAGDGGVFTFPGPALPPGGTPALAVSTVAGGLTIPWDVAFTPDGTLLFTERPGRIRALVGGVARVLATVGDVRAVGEGGMMGLAVDPRFATNRSIYTCFNTTAGDIKVVRWRVDPGYTSLFRVRAILTGLPANPSGRHSGCRPRFGPDGFLWIGTGDAAAGTNPQDPGSLGGKVLRVNRQGAAAPGNPAGARWYTLGHRNVQGLAFRPGTGQAYAVEHGPDRDDEINRLVAGGNYGWDPVPGYNEDVPMTDTAKFPGAVPALWSSGFPTLATSGAAFLSGDAWRDWNGALAVATLKAAHLRVFFLTADGRIAGSARVLSGYGRLRSPVLGPDGALYVTTSNGSGDRILRIAPS